MAPVLPSKVLALLLMPIIGDLSGVVDSTNPPIDPRLRFTPALKRLVAVSGTQSQEYGV